jgi:hypothetical protein
MAGIFGCVGLLLFLFAPYFEFIGGPTWLHSYPAGYRPISLPLHYSLYYSLTHVPYSRDGVIQVAATFAGYLLLALLVALAATRQARHTSLRWTVLLWLAAATLAVEVASLFVNARELQPPFLIPATTATGTMYLATSLLPSTVFAVVSALAALVAAVGQLVASLHAWRAIGNTADAAV